MSYDYGDHNKKLSSYEENTTEKNVLTASQFQEPLDEAWTDLYILEIS